MINYTFKVEKLHVIDTDDHTDVIHKITLRITGVDSETQASSFIMETFDLEVSDLSAFIEYESLTEETVLGWVNDDDLAGAKEEVERLVTTINERSTVKVEPWKTVVPPDVVPQFTETEAVITGDTPPLEE